MSLNILQKNSQIKVLVITGDRENYIFLENLLFQIQNSTFEVVWIDNFDGGLETLASKLFDVCLVSYYLEKFNGLQLLRTALKQGCKSAIILLTEYSDRQIDLAAIKAGAADYLDRTQLDSRLLERSIRYGIERKKREVKIQEQAALLDVTRDAILVRNLENKIIFWNKGAERLYGWSTEEAIGKDTSQLLFSSSYSLPIEVYDSVAQLGYWQGELNQVDKMGNSLLVQSSWTLVKDDFSQPKSILIFNTDITQKKLSDSQALLNQRLDSIGTLASGIAHDLNNLLTPMTMIVQLLQLQSTEKKYLEWISILEKNTNRARSLVRKILTFSQNYQGEYVPLPIKELILEIKDIIKQTFPKNINIEVNCSEQVGNIQGDATQIHQVLLNICLNARDAMANGGVLKIDVDKVNIPPKEVKLNDVFKVESYVKIAVSDTGIGISKDIFDKIFDPFFTTKEREKGTGLGLSTSLGIVKSHGGFIEVETEVKKGSVFQIYLPTSSSIAPKNTAEKLREIVGQGELILVVDDEASVCQATKSLLEVSGYECLVAQDGVEAIAIFAERKLEIKLVLVDAILPLMDGLTTIRTLRKIDRKAKVIMVSALASNLELLDTNDVNIQGFILKPYTGQELLETIDRTLTIND
jgi:hypothetical protein